MEAFSLSVSDGIDAFMRRIDDRQRNQIPFVTAYALTQTAKDIQAEAVAVMARVFDRPTRFALNALYVRPATKTSLVAEVAFKEGFGSIPAWRYLGPQVEGGPRVAKSHERALQRAGILRAGEFVVPGSGLKPDASGNIRGGDITRILSALGANPDVMQNWTDKSRKRAKRKARGVYFVVRGNRIPDGVYWRKGAREIVPVLIFIRPPHYTQRFPFYETARTVSQRMFAQRFHEGWARYVTAPVTLAA